MNKNLIKTMGTCLALVVVFGLIMFGINFYTGPLIEKNQTGELFAPAENVMPGGKFEIIGNDTLKNVPECFLNLFKETTGKGFVFRVNGTSQFSKEPFEVTIAVDPEGKIININLDKTTETKPLTPGVLESFIGNDGTLANVELVGGTTFTATAIKNAVEAGFKVLSDNDLIKEAVKTPEQILTELIPTVHTGLASEGVLKTSPVEGVSGNIASAVKANNNSGFALIMNKDEEKVLVVTNASGIAKVYNVEGTDVTADNAELVNEALAFTSKLQMNYLSNATTMFTKMMPGAANFVETNINVFNSVVSSVTFDVNGTKYYGFYSRTFSFGMMDAFVVFDESGKVVKFKTELIYDGGEYEIPAPDGLTGYEDNFNNITKPEEVDNLPLVSGATLSTTAMKQSAKDALAAFAKRSVGGAE